jgi:hypothetical protein
MSSKPTSRLENLHAKAWQTPRGFTVETVHLAARNSGETLGFALVSRQYKGACPYHLRHFSKQTPLSYSRIEEVRQEELGYCLGLRENDILLVRREDRFSLADQVTLEQQLATKGSLQLHLLRKTQATTTSTKAAMKSAVPDSTAPMVAGALCLASLKQDAFPRESDRLQGLPGRGSVQGKTLRVVKATNGRGKRVTLSPGRGLPNKSPRLGTASRTSLLDDDDE